MRRVACYAAESMLKPGESPDDALAALISIVQVWLRQKGAESLTSGSNYFAMRKGLQAHLLAEKFSVPTATEWDISLEEPTPQGRFVTRVVIGAFEKSLNVFIELRAGADAYEIAPVRVEAHAPRVLRSLLGSRTWTVGKTPISLKAVHWLGDTGGNRLIAVIGHSERNLPIVAISEHEGRVLHEGLPEDLAQDLAGLALVAHLDESASWAITVRRGREWSCFEGAIRVYWPMRQKGGSAYDHPYWTRQRLIAGSDSREIAAQRIRSELRRLILELSTYAVDEPAVLTRLRGDAERARFDEAKRVAEARGDQAALAEEYFNEAARLASKLAEANEENESLKAKVASLGDAWRHVKNGGDTELPPEPETRVEFVQDAVDRARREYGHLLHFGDSVDAGVAQLASDAGPPDKIYDHLKTLAELAEARRAGSLGMNMLQWLNERGITASNESATVTTSKSEMKKRTWHINGMPRPFTTHLKPNEHTGPDKCARIYFEYDDSSRMVVVGWVGRHP